MKFINIIKSDVRPRGQNLWPWPSPHVTWLRYVWPRPRMSGLVVEARHAQKPQATTVHPVAATVFQSIYHKFTVISTIN